MEVLLVRHARPEVVAGGRQAAAPGLTDEGRARAERMAKALADGWSGRHREIVSGDEDLHMRLR